MELLKPIFVKRWVAENNYIEYVFDNNPNNNYKNAIVLKDYIFRDINIKETLDKIAYHIFNYENKNSRDILGLDQHCNYILFGAVNSTKDKNKGFEYLTEALKIYSSDDLVKKNTKHHSRHW